MEEILKEQFNHFRQDLQTALKNHSNFNSATVGDEHKKDYGSEDGNFKFKIFLENQQYLFVLDPSQIEDYQASKPKEKNNLIKKIINDLEKQVGSKQQRRKDHE